MVTVPSAQPPSRGPRGFQPAFMGRYRLLQGSLLALRAGPALILLILLAVVSLTTRHDQLTHAVRRRLTAWPGCTARAAEMR